MAELRRDDPATIDGRPVETGPVTETTAPARNVRIDERQQPLAGAQELGATAAPVVTNRRVIDSQVLYEGPASDAPFGAAAATGTADRRAMEPTPAVRTETRHNVSDNIAADTARAADPRLNRSSDRVAEAGAQQAELFPAAELERFRSRWDQVQVSFVDDPEQAVRQADELVASVVKRISDQFAEQRSRLEGQWHKQDDAATTEELRRSLRQYRVFFDRLLSL